MRRRPFMIAFAGLLPGCTGFPAFAGDDADECVQGLSITHVYPRAVERDYISGEYVRVKNYADHPIDVTGFAIRYEPELDYVESSEYTIPELEMESESRLVVQSRSGSNAVLTSAPPTYMHYAGFGEGKDTSVSDTAGRVTLRDRDDDIIDVEHYDVQNEE